jgi:plasmid stability protein
MASLLIKNIPESIHIGIKRRALKNHRSLNREIISILEKEVETSSSRSVTNSATTPDYSESTLAAYPPELAARLRSLRDLNESLLSRQVDFEAWENAASDSRR